MKTYSIILCVLLLPFLSMAQITVKGIVTDAATKEALPFTAVAIKGTTIGTTTDVDGRFMLKVSENHRNGSLQVSCVGYKAGVFSLNAMELGKDQAFALESSVSEIGEVAVAAKSKYPQTLVRTAIDKIASNYLNKSYNYEINYVDEKPVDKAVRKRNATVLFYDKTGYGRSNALQSFLSCNYKFTAAKRNFTVRTIGDGMTNVDDLLLFDVVRQSGTVLDVARLADFDLKIEKSSILNGDSVWVISYVNKHPGLLTSNDWNASKNTGTLFINKADFAVVKHVSETQTRLKNEVSQTLAVDTAARLTSLPNLQYRAETTYEKQDGVYVLKQITYTSTVDKRSSKLEVTGVKTKDIQIIAGREYLERLP